MFLKQIRLVCINTKIQVMKRMVFVFSVMLISACSMGQKNGIDAFFARYEGREGFTTVNISGDLFSLFADVSEDPELKEINLEISSVRVLSINDEFDNGTINFYDELKNTMEKGDYEELMMVKDSGNDVRIMVKTSGRIINELLIVTGGKDNAMVQIKGRFEKKELAKLSHANIEGVSYLEELEADVN